MPEIKNMRRKTKNLNREGINNVINRQEAAKKNNTGINNPRQEAKTVWPARIPPMRAKKTGIRGRRGAISPLFSPDVGPKAGKFFIQGLISPVKMIDPMNFRFASLCY